MRISDWSSDVCSSDLADDADLGAFGGVGAVDRPFAVADPGAAAAVLDRPGHRQNFAAQPARAPGEMGVGRGDRVCLQQQAPDIDDENRQPTTARARLGERGCNDVKTRWERDTY